MTQNNCPEGQKSVPKWWSDNVSRVATFPQTFSLKWKIIQGVKSFETF